MSKKFLFFIVLFISTGIHGLALTDIIPLKKPVQTKEETEKKLLIDVLKPLKKPILKSETKEKEETKIVKKKIKTGFILPKKKPLISGNTKSEKTSQVKI